MVKLELTDAEVESLTEYIRYYFIQSIRCDDECDSLLYLYNVLKIYEKLGGLTEYSDYESDN